MIDDYKSLQWYKDIFFPTLITIAIVIESYYVIREQRGVAADTFHGQIWFLWVWVALVFVSCSGTAIGAMLRKLNKKSFIWFEYPGSIAAAFSLTVYAGSLLFSRHPGPATLSIAVTLLLALHFIINFFIIQRSYFSKTRK